MLYERPDAARLICCASLREPEDTRIDEASIFIPATIVIASIIGLMAAWQFTGMQNAKTLDYRYAISSHIALEAPSGLGRSR